LRLVAPCSAPCSVLSAAQSLEATEMVMSP
jgi:hypothetical protein